eukprot:GHVU01104151.1.p2 GENE.GHVU01104151.1~~GHVU01104151.1.p2  ORF type:complete len:366 (-),score=35.14 GHVU01104151.1:1755-2852(-)
MSESKAKDSNSCIFPALGPSTPFELFRANVAAVKATSKKWREVSETSRDEFEAFQLVLATNGHPHASAAIVRVYRNWEAKEYIQEDGSLAAAAWLAASWEALRRVCEPLDRDAREAIRAKLEALPGEAARRFQGNITELSNYFRLLLSDATQYKAGYTDAALADLLIRSAPVDYQAKIRMHLLDEQEIPERVLDLLEKLTKATGACLGQPQAVAIREETANYVGSVDRPQLAGQLAFRGRRGRRGDRGGARGGGTDLGRRGGPGQANGAASLAGNGAAPQAGICQRCGRSGFHNTGVPCPALEAVCRNCQKQGHFARVCKQSRLATASPTTTKTGGASASVGFVDATVVSSTDPTPWFALYSPPL